MEGKQLEPAERPLTKTCKYCGQERPIGEFRRRTGRRAGPDSRRGACRACRRRMKAGGTAEAAGPAMAGAGGAPAREPAPAEADKPSATAGPRPVGAVADAGENPAPAPAAGRKRKKRRGKRGGRKRNGRRKTRTAGAAAEPAAEPAGAPDPGTAPERTGGGTAAKPSRTAPSGREPAAGPKPAADADRAPARPAEAGRRPRKKATYVLPPLPPPPPRPKGPDPSVLSPGKSGVIWMRGRTDKGRSWRQETDLETAVTLVREYAAVVVNRRTIRRLYSNKAFREYILKRDNYTCYFCGRYGDTIDHIVPRAKGGHTTPLNCVTACRECNQNKAALDLEEFMERLPPRSGEPI